MSDGWRQGTTSAVMHFCGRCGTRLAGPYAPCYNCGSVSYPQVERGGDPVSFNCPHCGKSIQVEVKNG